MINFEIIQENNRYNWDLDTIVGIIPLFLTEGIGIRAQEQINRNYAHGGGWRKLSEFSLDKENMSIKYPGDPKMKPLAKAKMDDEEIYIYQSGFTLILDSDGSFEIARLD